MSKDRQNIFLIQEFEKMLLEIICPFEYKMDLFVKDIMRDDYMVEKVQYRKWHTEDFYFFWEEDLKIL